MDLVSVLINIIVIGLVFALLYWLIEQMPLPAPFAMVAKVIMALAIVLYLLRLLPGVGLHL